MNLLQGAGTGSRPPIWKAVVAALLALIAAYPALDNYVPALGDPNLLFVVKLIAVLVAATLLAESVGFVSMSHRASMRDIAGRGLAKLASWLDDYSRNIEARMPKPFQTSVFHPRYLAMGHSSTMIVSIHRLEQTTELTQLVAAQAGSDMVEQKANGDLSLIPGIDVRVSLSSPTIEFSGSSLRQVSTTITLFQFAARPKADARPGSHSAVVAVTDPKTDRTLSSFTFEVPVRDLILGISRPLLLNTVAVVAALGSLITFGLVLMQDIDKSFGLPAGSGAAITAGLVMGHVRRLYYLPSKEPAVRE